MIWGWRDLLWQKNMSWWPSCLVELSISLIIVIRALSQWRLWSFWMRPTQSLIIWLTRMLKFLRYTFEMSYLRRQHAQWLELCNWNSVACEQALQLWRGKRAERGHDFPKWSACLQARNPEVLSSIPAPTAAVWHENFAGVFFCGLVIFCVLRELIFCS